MPEQIAVIKLNPMRQEIWRYYGKILEKKNRHILLEAFFDREDRLFFGMPLGKGDRFLELYFTDRWFNIFEIHDRTDDHLKGWYCNVTTPAQFSPGVISYVDLALDLLVYPAGQYLVLDQDEFQALDIDVNQRVQAEQALDSLLEIALAGQMGNIIHQPTQ